MPGKNRYPVAPCVHCGKKRPNRPRGLCWQCYYTPGVRELYGVRGKFGAYGRRGLHEPTEAELEATIAEQRKKLPKWWTREMGNTE